MSHTIHIKKILHNVATTLFLLSTLFSNMSYGLTNNKNPLSSNGVMSSRQGALSWNSVQIGSEDVWYPEDNWQQYDEMEISLPTQESKENQIAFQRKVTSGRYGASVKNRQGIFSGSIEGALVNDAKKISANQMTETIEQLVEEEVIVVGKYSRQHGMGVIFGFKVHKKQSEKNNPVISVEAANFTPYHGQKWAASRSYLNDREKQSANKPGYNPFIMHTRWNNENADDYGQSWNNKNKLPTFSNLPQQYAGDVDPTFYNISWDKFQVALGHSMRYWNANIGYVAMAESEITDTVESWSGWFTQGKTTRWFTTIKPIWYVAMSSQAQDGEVAYSCVLLNQRECLETSSSEHIANSGISLAKWEGRGFLDYKNGPEYLGERSQTTGGWAMFILLTLFSVITAGAGTLAAYYLFGALGAVISIPREMGSDKINGKSGNFAGFLASIFPSGSFYPKGVRMSTEQVYTTLNSSNENLDDAIVNTLYPNLRGHIGNGTLVNYDGSRRFLDYASLPPQETSLVTKCEWQNKGAGDEYSVRVKTGECNLEYAKQIAPEWNAKGGQIINAVQHTMLGLNGSGYCPENQPAKNCGLNDSGLIMRRDSIPLESYSEKQIKLEEEQGAECKRRLQIDEITTRAELQEFYKCMRSANSE